MISEQLKNAFLSHAVAEYPKEACGFIVAREGVDTFVACENRAAKPTQDFLISPQDYARTQTSVGKIIGVIHSHPGGRAAPSPVDLTVCEALDVPLWVILALGVDAEGEIAAHGWCEFGPTGYMAPLVGRPFSHGVLDCYSIVRDYYRIERDQWLPDFDRADNWWDDGVSDLYTENFAKAGFEDVGQDTEPAPGDVLLMSIRSRNGVPNHAGIYLGDGIMLHHMHGQLSGRTVWGGMWRKCLRTVLRFKGLPNE